MTGFHHARLGTMASRLGGSALTLAVAFTLQGAICFLVGSLLMLPETALEAKESDGRQNSQRTSQPNSH